MFLIVEKKSGVVYRSTGSAGKQTVNIEDGDKMYFRFDINNNSMSAEFYDIMLNLGDTPLPYEPHAEQSLAIQTPNGLPGIPVTSGGNYTGSTGQQWVCDEIDLERGKCIKRTHIQEVLGTEKLSSIQVDNTTTRFAFKPDYPGNSLVGMYTHGEYKKVWDVDEEAAYVAPDLAVLRINKGRHKNSV